MELIHKKHSKLKKALKTLEDAVEKFQEKKSILGKDSSCQIKIGEYETYRDSMIKRFEYSFDATWNYLKTYLEVVCSIQLQTKGSRTVFRECLKVQTLYQFG